MTEREREFNSSELAIVENIHLVCLLDLTADFGVKNKRKLDADLSAAWKNKTGIQAVCTQ